MPVEGGEETKVLDSVHPLGLWVLGKGGIYFISATDDLCFCEFNTGKTLKILHIARGLGRGGITVSPNGRTILYTQMAEAGSDLMLVENFR
jgi:hypothetical protein